MGHQPVRRTTQRPDRDPTPHVAVVDGDHPAGDPLLDGEWGQRRPSLGERDRRADDEQTQQRVESVTGPSRSKQRSQFAEREVSERVGPESLRDGIEREAAVVQTLPGSANGVGTVEEAHVVIVPSRQQQRLPQDYRSRRAAPADCVLARSRTLRER